jgi:deazaflavin-dependent oxidoreductase (nitroreductase family)
MGAAETVEQNERNAAIIAEFRANGGRVGGRFEGAPLVVLHHRGARSGAERTTPLMYLPVDGGYAVFASNAGGAQHPAWYHNLAVDPHTTVEVGDRVEAVVAREALGDERDSIWERQKSFAPGFADYERSAAPRAIPVVVLEPTS